MRLNHFFSKAIIATFCFFNITLIYAGTPLWTFTALTPTTVTVASGATATVEYRITNQSRTPHTLEMQAINGINQVTTGGNCGNPFSLGYNESCTLNLSINGSDLTHSIVGGPVVCQQGNPNQCYQPGDANILRITPTTASYTVGGSIAGLSGGVILQNNGGDNLNLNSNGAFTFSTPVSAGSAYNVTVSQQPIGQACTVSNGSGTINGSDITNVSVNCVDLAILDTSIADLALSVSGITEYGVTGLSGTQISGVSRIITISNIGAVDAINFVVSIPALPSGTTSTTTCGSTLPAGNSCTVSIIPGNTPSADINSHPCYNGTAPIPGIIEATADNAYNSVSTNVVILDYGCVYQGGYVFAFDDTTSNNSSVMGKAVSTTTISFGIVWSSNGTSPNDVSLDMIPGIDASSTASVGSPTYLDSQNLFNTTYNNSSTYPFPASNEFFNCDGNIDGACNSRNILALYNTYITNYSVFPPRDLVPGSTDSSYYAAGLCNEHIATYNGWYLPAICELGFQDTGSDTGSGCGTSSPTTQNIQSSLISNSRITDIIGAFWSSTEVDGGADVSAWVQDFSGGTTGQQKNTILKSAPSFVRCVRVFS